MLTNITIFKNPNYRTLLISNTLWWYTLAAQTFVVGWLVLDLTDSALTVSLMSFWRRASQLAIGFFAGPLVDRLGSRQTMVWTQYIVCGVWVVIVGLLWLKSLAPWHLGLATFLIGMTWTINAPARAVLIPDLLGKHKTLEAMILESFSLGVIGIIGPYITGWQLALFGPIGVYLFLIVLVGVNLILLRTLFQQATRSQAVQRNYSMRQSIQEGILYIRHTPILLAVTLVSVVLNVLIFPAMALMPVFARDILQQGPVGLGLLGAGSGIGLFVGLYIMHRLRDQVSNNYLFMGGAILECIAFIIFAFSQNLWLSWLMLIGSGLGHAGFSTMRASLLLTEASDEMRGRTTSVISLTQGIGLPGELVTGYAADAVGAPLTVGVQAILSTVGVTGVAWYLSESRSKKDR